MSNADVVDWDALSINKSTSLCGTQGCGVELTGQMWTARGGELFLDFGRKKTRTRTKLKYCWVTVTVTQSASHAQTVNIFPTSATPHRVGLWILRLIAANLMMSSYAWRATRNMRYPSIQATTLSRSCGQPTSGDRKSGKLCRVQKKKTTSKCCKQKHVALLTLYTAAPRAEKTAIMIPGAMLLVSPKPSA